MATAVDPSEIAATLTIEEIPVKLRCAVCNKLAINAFRMPCCDQSICEECQESLPQACPVCLHEPVNKDDCRPNKALRTTIKVFLKKKAVEREAARKKEMLAQAAATPVTPATSIADETWARQPSETFTGPTIEPHLQPENVKEEAGDAPQSSEAGGNLDKIPLSRMDIPQPSIESPGPQDAPMGAPSQTVGDGGSALNNGDGKNQPKSNEQTMVESGQWQQGNGAGLNNMGFAFDMNGGFPNMANMGMGDFSQMMQFMPNGMPNSAMGQFPNVMGMPGMGMDPMAMSQGMFGGFGGPGVGISGMNMGMGLDAGQNPYGGFNGQTQAFNPNQYSGNTNGMGGNFGANTGYGGNNMPQHQGNFNQMHQHQNFNHDFQHGYHNQGFHNRGRGRGRSGFPNAGRGRGYGPPTYQGRQVANNEAIQNQTLEQNTRRGSPVYTPMDDSDSQQQPQTGQNDIINKLNDSAPDQAAEGQLNKELDPGDAEDDIEIPKSPVKEEKVTQNAEPVNDQPEIPEQQPESERTSVEEDQSRQVQSVHPQGNVDESLSSPDRSGPAQSAMLPPSIPNIPTGPARSMSGLPAMATSPRGRGFGRGFGRGVTEFRPASRGRGSVPPFDKLSRSNSNVSTEQSVRSPTIPKGLGVEGAPTGPKALRQMPSNASVKPPQDAGFSIVGRASGRPRTNGSLESPSLARSRSQSRSHSSSPVRDGTSSRHHRRRRSTSQEREFEGDKKRSRHERSSRKDDEYYEEKREAKGSRARAASTHSSNKRSSHRSHRDYEKESSKSKHRSHRSHRERSRSIEKEDRGHRKRSRSPELHMSGASRRNGDDGYYKAKDEDEARSSRKRRQRDEEGRDRDRKRSRREDDHETTDKETTLRSKHEREGGTDSQRTYKAQEKLSEAVVEPPKGPKGDQHALEREARNRERQMKEIQRRALMEGKGSGSRGKTNGRAGERRASYKYEDEDLTSRVEKERESHRWG